MPQRDPRPRFWLLKSEADCFSFDDLLAARKHTTGWDGVRNHQARNFMRDDMRVGDGVLFHHSNAAPPGIAGIARVARTAYPDPTQFDPAAQHFDPKSDRRAPTWLQVDVEGLARLPRFVSMETLRGSKPLAGMLLLRPGQRLSVLPVTPAEWREIVHLGGLDPDAISGLKPMDLKGLE